ncbi:hypothetical protein NLI96_g4370 [Meripilus lineatus]|uniref:Uncharacterized protein n=1 Tax=Meripilus lineatus TaxID=2056292 RepID=A0AAD5YK61_9APHY|nr:hypothetical protein NLI96_g4370 [Physisporinus lineatus]
MEVRPTLTRPPSANLHTSIEQGSSRPAKRPRFPDKGNQPTVPTFVIRGIINDPNTVADPRKAVKQFYKVASLPDPPLRLAIGLVAVGAIKQQLGKIGEGVDQYASWSEDLGFD